MSEQVVIRGELYYDEAGNNPLPSLIGPFENRQAASEYLASLGSVWGPWCMEPIFVPEAHEAAIRRDQIEKDAQIAEGVYPLGSQVLGDAPSRIAAALRAQIGDTDPVSGNSGNGN